MNKTDWLRLFAIFLGILVVGLGIVSTVTSGLAVMNLNDIPDNIHTALTISTSCSVGVSVVTSIWIFIIFQLTKSGMEGFIF